MSYFNCGAYVGDRRVKSKKELRELLKADPSKVFFDGTNTPVAGGYRGDQIPEEVILSVVGPDPWRVRRWYAIVEPNKQGGLRVR